MLCFPDGSDLLADLADLLDPSSPPPLSALLDYDGSVAPRLRESLARANAALASGPVPADAIEAHSEAIDVTVPVQCLVEDGGRLAMFEGTKSDLAGFYDPTPSAAADSDGEEGGDKEEEEAESLQAEKQLLVVYLYQGARHRVAVADSEPLRLPRNAHRIADS